MKFIFVWMNTVLITQKNGLELKCGCHRIIFLNPFMVFFTVFLWEVLKLSKQKNAFLGKFLGSPLRAVGSEWARTVRGEDIS